MYKTTAILVYMYNKFILVICHMYNWYQSITLSFIHTRVWFVYSLYIALPLDNPALTYLAPSSCDVNGPP